MPEPRPLLVCLHPLQEVAAWLSPADARRARLVCRQWRGSLNALSTKATTPVDSGTFSRWRGCLSSLVVSLPCVKEVTIPGKVSDVGMQQLPLLAAAGQLRELRIPCAQALRDRSLLVSTRAMVGCATCARA